MASEEELQELLSLARERLHQPYREEGPPLGMFFDPVPAAEAPGSLPAEIAGEKRKRVMIDDYEMEGGEGGDLNVTRMVPTSPKIKIHMVLTGPYMAIYLDTARSNLLDYTLACRLETGTEAAGAMTGGARTGGGRTIGSCGRGTRCAHLPFPLDDIHT